MIYEIIQSVLKIIFKPKKPFLQKNIFKEFERATREKTLVFPNKIFLPMNYGRSMPERVVEIFLCWLSYRSGYRILDIGHANAMECHLNMVRTLPEPKNLTGIDIAVPVYDVEAVYNHSILGDITNVSLPDDSFDLIWCISALEHIGMDNSGYVDNVSKSKQNDMDVQAIKEMVRLLSIGGSVLITVPYGKREDHGWFMNYDQEHLHSLLNVIRQKTKVSEWYFKHTFSMGWSMVKPEELRYVGYYDQNNSGSAGLAAIYITKLNNMSENEGFI